jgi:hypothetical protein
MPKQGSASASLTCLFSVTTDSVQLLVARGCGKTRNATPHDNAALNFNRVQMALEEDKYCARNLVRFHRLPNADVLFLYILPGSYFPGLLATDLYLEVFQD